jgi:hypothetical protein
VLLESFPVVVLGLAGCYAVFVMAQPSREGLAGTASSPFPSHAVKQVKWLDSLAGGIKEATAGKKPICLILAGQRPAGDC